MATSITSSQIAPMIGLCVANQQYRVDKHIATGTFGALYQGTHVTSNEMVAIKLEKADVESPQLRYEARIYKHMKNSKGFPSMKFYGQEDEYCVLVIDLLGKSLEDLFNFCNRKFSLKTILMVADEMVNYSVFAFCFSFRVRCF